MITRNLILIGIAALLTTGGRFPHSRAVAAEETTTQRDARMAWWRRRGLECLSIGACTPCAGAVGREARRRRREWIMTIGHISAGSL